MVLALFSRQESPEIRQQQIGLIQVLTLRAETRVAALETGRAKTKVGSRGSVKATAKTSKSEKR
jgi:hypothetical protein